MRTSFLPAFPSGIIFLLPKISLFSICYNAGPQLTKFPQFFSENIFISPSF